MKPEERANIMKTLKELTEKIALLQSEMNPAAQASSAKVNHSQSKTKTDVSVAWGPAGSHLKTETVKNCKKHGAPLHWCNS